MALKKTIIQRLFSNARCPNPGPSLKPDPGDAAGLIRRTLQRPKASWNPVPGIRTIPTGHDQLIEKLRGFDMAARDRIRFQGLIPPPKMVNKVLRASNLEMIKAHLKGIQNTWVSYSDFLEICKEGCSGDEERAAVMAKLLDDSGDVIVLANAVCLHPHQVVKAIQGLFPLGLSPNDPRRNELDSLEKQKRMIEQEADALVRRELWMGLGYMVAQTALFMRLTFWELSWDVMEPICFYVTSAYFMGGYAFFLTTSKEPSFEGFYQSRLQAKLKKLMTTRGFDVHRYQQLRTDCYPDPYKNININHQHVSCIKANTTSFAT